MKCPVFQISKSMKCPVHEISKSINYYVHHLYLSKAKLH